MNKNYYDILQINQNASPEIIEKAYKTLAKKYHPDLQNEVEKQKAEGMMKKINEAYEILGNEEKRKEYDAKLKEERYQIEQEKLQKNQNYNQNYNQNANQYNQKESNNTIHDYGNAYQNMKQAFKQQKEELKNREKMQEKINQQYQNAYEDYLRSLGYKVKHKWTKENYRDFFITIAIIIILFAILWAIPPVRNYMIDFYEQNPILKAIVDVFIGIIRGIWKFIVDIFN